MKNLLGKILSILVILFVFSSFSLTKTSAATPDFQHNVTASYKVLNDKSANVNYNIKTTNNLNNNYLTSFTLILPFEPVEISTANSQTPVRVKNLKKVSEANLYELSIDFINPIFGKEKAFDWSFSFKIKDILIDHAMQNAVFLPTFVNDQNITSYNINVTIPKTFGEIKNIYGNAGITETSTSYNINFSAGRNKTSNVMVLIGPDQQYEFEISSTEDLENQVILPVHNEYQNIFYNEFPSKSFTLENVHSSNKVNLIKDQKISGVINTKKGEDKTKDFSKVYDLTANYLKEKFAKVNLGNKETYQKAEIIYQEVLPTFTIDRYALNDNLKSELVEDRTNVNIEEINLIYKQLLGLAGIESRGAYGYVFPIQPFERDQYFVEQHIWTEVWDGEKWIVVDPTWLISSNGTKYFNNNEYHHIKFGNYHDFSQTKDFLNSKRFITIKPLKEKLEIDKSGDLTITANSSVYLNKELKISLQNNTNYPIAINNITATKEDKNIKVITETLEKTFILFPGDNIDLTVKFDYQLLILNQDYSFDLKINYSDGDNQNLEFNREVKTVIPSNISNYLSYIIIGLFIVIGGLSLIGLSSYRVRR